MRKEVDSNRSNAYYEIEDIPLWAIRITKIKYSYNNMLIEKWMK